MASATMRKTYHTPGVINGSLAYDFDALERRLEGIAPMEPDMFTGSMEETSADVIAKAREHAKARVRTVEHISPVAIFGFAALTVMLSLIVFTYVELTAISSSVVQLKGQVSALQTEQVALQARYEQAFDLAGVKEAALAAGMTQPSDRQVYYIDLSAPDMAVVYESVEKKGLDEVLPALGRAVQTAVEYFR